VIDGLLGRGVLVTSAAGNFATSREYYPAAFAGQPSAVDKVPLVSVGALNPNGTRAVFSDGGRWVTGWAAGAAVISTFPVDVNGSDQPDIRVPDQARESLDLDDYRSGFASWSGTSFAAPMMAGTVVRAMLAPLQGTSPDPSLRLDVPGATAAADRVLRALGQLPHSA
jgi:subtilisin family serine protease